MNEKTIISAQIDKKTRNDVQKIFDSVGVSMSAAIESFFRYIVITKEVPSFNVEVPIKYFEDYTKEEILERLNKSHEEVENGNFFMMEQVKELFDLE